MSKTSGDDLELWKLLSGANDVVTTNYCIDQLVVHKTTENRLSRMIDNKLAKLIGFRSQMYVEARNQFRLISRVIEATLKKMFTDDLMSSVIPIVENFSLYYRQKFTFLLKEEQNVPEYFVLMSAVTNSMAELVLAACTGSIVTMDELAEILNPAKLDLLKIDIKSRDSYPADIFIGYRFDDPINSGTNNQFGNLC